MPKLNVLVAGSTGYIGIQLIKLLNKHKYVKIKYLCGNTSVGKKISYYDKTIGLKRLPKIVKFNKKFLNEIDVVFTALPNGEAQVISKYLNKQNVLIDLAADFRLQKALDYKKWYKKDHKAKYNIKNSIYSLPEITGKKVQDYKIISCPGCYPTSILLPLIPLLKNRLIKNHNIIIDSKSGYSGAGKNLEKVAEQLEGAVKAHGKQAKAVRKHIAEMKNMKSPAKKYVSDAQRKAAFASGYKEKGKKKKESVLDRIDNKLKERKNG